MSWTDVFILMVDDDLLLSKNSTRLFCNKSDVKIGLIICRKKFIKFTQALCLGMR